MFRVLSKSKMGLVLAFLFGASLLFFRTSSKSSNFFNSDSIVASVSGTPISNTKFNRTMQMNINKFSNIFGKELNQEEIKSFNIPSLALNALIANAVFENEYNEINFKLDDQVIASKTKERLPQLYDSNNKLNNSYLKSFLNQQQLKIEDIVQIINFETRDDYFKESFFKINYPKIFNKKIKRFESHKREISYIEKKKKNIKIEKLINNNLPEKHMVELEKFYETNTSNYMSEEERDIEYIVIDKKLLKNQFLPTLSEIENYYNNNKNYFLEDEKRSFVQFNFKNKNNAKKFKDVIKNLNTDQVLEYASANNIRFNEFKNLSSNQILEDISNSLFSLSINQQSEIIETSLAKHVLILNEIKKSNQLTIKEAEDEIISIISESDSSNFYNDLTNQISDSILSGEKIKDIAKNFNLKIQNVESLKISNRDFDEKNKNLSADLIQKSFNSNKDFVSDLLEINENLSYLYNVTNIRKSTAIPFSNLIDKVFDDWKYSLQKNKITKDIEKNKDNINYLDELSKNYNKKITKLTAEKNSKEIPVSFLNKVFDANIKKNIEHIIEDRIYIALIRDIVIPKDHKNLDPILLQNDLQASFGDELMKTKKVKVNEALITALIEIY